jgi:hypothetical protein
MVTQSVNFVHIRLTDERWTHILTEHGELLGWQELILQTVASPDRVLAGGMGELLAVREVNPGKWLVVVYKEQDADGFIITAFLTRRAASLNRRQQVWP